MSQNMQHLKATFLVNWKQYDGYEKSVFNFWFGIIFYGARWWNIDYTSTIMNMGMVWISKIILDNFIIESV